MNELELYKKLYGELLFPTEGNNSDIIVEQPNAYLYSEDGIKWLPFSELDSACRLWDFVARKRPDGVTIGTKETFEECTPDILKLQYSNDNGHSWLDVVPAGRPSSAGNWIYHGNHKYTWFRKKPNEEIVKILYEIGVAVPFKENYDIIVSTWDEKKALEELSKDKNRKGRKTVTIKCQDFSFRDEYYQWENGEWVKVG